MYVRDFVNKQYIRKSGPCFIRASGCSTKNGLCFTDAFAHVLSANKLNSRHGRFIPRPHSLGSVEMEVGREIVSKLS